MPICLPSLLLWRIQDFENGQADSSGFASEAIDAVRCKVTENEALFFFTKSRLLIVSGVLVQVVLICTYS